MSTTEKAGTRGRPSLKRQSGLSTTDTDGVAVPTTSAGSDSGSTELSSVDRDTGDFCESKPYQSLPVGSADQRHRASSLRPTSRTTSVPSDGTKSLPRMDEGKLSPAPWGSSAGINNSLTAVMDSPSARLRRQSTIETKKVEKDEEEERVNQYRILGKLGQGAYGVVREAEGSLAGDRYAVKIMSKKRLAKIARNRMFGPRPGGRGGPGGGRGGPGGRPGMFGPRGKGSNTAQESELLLQVKREIAILKNLDHPNVISLKEVMDDPNEDELYMVFELCENGAVMNDDMDTTFDEETSLSYFIDLLLGVEYLHSLNIIHRDIKPENLLVDDAKEHIKITDFGVSEWFSDLEDDKKLSKTAGSPAFMAPEAVTSEPGRRLEYAGKPADIWAMGVTLYCFLYGELPFKSPNIMELYDLIRTAEVQFPDRVPPITDDLRDFILRLLEKDPDKRITIDGMRSHPWISQVKDLPSRDDNCTPPEDVTEGEVAVAFSNLTISELCTVLQNIRTRSFQRINMSRMGRSKSMDYPSIQHNNVPLPSSNSASFSGTSSPLDVSVDFVESTLVSISTSMPDAADGPILEQQEIDFAHLTPQQENILVRLASPGPTRRSSVGKWGDRSRSPSPNPQRRATTGAERPCGPEISVVSPPVSPSMTNSPSVPHYF